MSAPQSTNCKGVFLAVFVIVVSDGKYGEVAGRQKQAGTNSNKDFDLQKDYALMYETHAGKGRQQCKAEKILTCKETMFLCLRVRMMATSRFRSSTGLRRRRPPFASLGPLAL